MFNFLRRKPKLLLHICCAGCGAYVADVLKERYRVTLYFFNPNIFPESEHALRLEETKRIAAQMKLKLIIGKADHAAWLERVKGLESDPEKGGRCRICYWERLQAAAEQAQKSGIENFTTTLTVSPHKDAAAISVIGKELAEKYGRIFVDQDFKKMDGFKKSVALSRTLNLYRQDYCGCEFSRIAKSRI